MSGSKTKSGSDSESTTFTFKPSDIEKLLQGVNLEIVGQQLDSIMKQSAWQDQFFAASQPFLDQMKQEGEIRSELLSPEQERQRMIDQIESEDLQRAAGDEMLEMELERIRQGPGATDEQKALINEATEAQIARGESDIQAFGENAVGMIREELAPSRGLRPSDTPIQDRGFRVGEEMTRQQGNLVTGLRGAQAQAELNFPLAAGGQQAAWTQFQQGLAQSGSNFQQQLAQNAQANRLNLFGQVGGLGLGLAGGGQPQTGLQQAFKPQLGQTTSQTQSTTGGNAYGRIWSSRKWKGDNREINVEEILVGLLSLPIEKWQYTYPGTGEGGDHIGTYAEDFTEAFGIGDGRTIDYTNALGVLMASVQALAAQVKELKDGMETG